MYAVDDDDDVSKEASHLNIEYLKNARGYNALYCCLFWLKNNFPTNFGVKNLKLYQNLDNDLE